MQRSEGSRTSAGGRSVPAGRRLCAGIFFGVQDPERNGRLARFEAVLSTHRDRDGQCACAGMVVEDRVGVLYTGRCS